jgi:tetratricopeptide (TPR) repeat protein
LPVAVVGCHRDVLFSHLSVSEEGSMYHSTTFRSAPVRRTLVLAALCTLLGVGPTLAQEHEHPAGDAATLGSVTFPVSCAPGVATAFERAVAMLHSFWFVEAVEAFQSIAAADPSCAMAYWGIAMTEMGNPMARVMPAETVLREGAAAAARAVELAPNASHRERMYIDAVDAYYRTEGDLASRMRAHEEALEALHSTHPEDAEATIFYARSVIANAPPTDLTFARQMVGAQLLEPLFEERPDHPGLAHYLIHAYDAPALADRATDAAFAYADIAPSAPHALHMPSHIFTRLGYWEESIETNRRSAEAEPVPDAAVHPMDYMVYAYLQLGRDAAAKEVVDRAVQNPDRYYGGVLGYNFAAMPARYALERNAWADAATLRIPVDASPYVEAITRFARAIGAARGGQAEAAPAEIEALARLEAALQSQGDAYWATIVGAQRIAASAWDAHARGDDAAALRLAEEAASLEETVEKHPVTPGPILPARELQGDLLLELDRPAEALIAYETTLVREPNRARTIYGAARAAELAGDRDKAGEHYDALLTLMSGADQSRPELAEARRFLGR